MYRSLVRLGVALISCGPSSFALLSRHMSAGMNEICERSMSSAREKAVVKIDLLDRESRDMFS